MRRWKRSTTRLRYNSKSSKLSRVGSDDEWQDLSGYASDANEGAQSNEAFRERLRLQFALKHDLDSDTEDVNSSVLKKIANP